VHLRYYAPQAVDWTELNCLNSQSLILVARARIDEMGDLHPDSRSYDWIWARNQDALPFLITGPSIVPSSAQNSCPGQPTLPRLPTGRCEVKLIHW
jgi:hypothetical protein